MEMIRMQSINKNMVGYCLKDEEGYQIKLHVCGYLNNKVLIQDKAGMEPKQYTVYENSKGNYFNFKGERIYLRYID
jgi:hypothetical protein